MRTCWTLVWILSVSSGCVCKSIEIVLTLRNMQTAIPSLLAYVLDDLLFKSIYLLTLSSYLWVLSSESFGLGNSLGSNFYVFIWSSCECFWLTKSYLTFKWNGLCHFEELLLADLLIMALCVLKFVPYPCVFLTWSIQFQSSELWIVLWKSIAKKLLLQHVVADFLGYNKPC